jgi:hypothetical protein
MPFQVVALICALGQDPAECQPPTARDVVVVGEAGDELACLRRGMVDAGKLYVLVGEHDYVKIMCRRKRD